MTVSHYPPLTGAGEIERILCNLTDGTFRVVAVEVFDHPDATAADEYVRIGPWVVGPEDEVYAWLSKYGSEDYAEQYSAP